MGNATGDIVESCERAIEVLSRLQDALDTTPFDWHTTSSDHWGRLASILGGLPESNSDSPSAGLIAIWLRIVAVEARQVDEQLMSLGSSFNEHWASGQLHGLQWLVRDAVISGKRLLEISQSFRPSRFAPPTGEALRDVRLTDLMAVATEYRRVSASGLDLPLAPSGPIGLDQPRGHDGGDAAAFKSWSARMGERVLRAIHAGAIHPTPQMDRLILRLCDGATGVEDIYAGVFERLVVDWLPQEKPGFGGAYWEYPGHWKDYAGEKRRRGECALALAEVLVREQRDWSSVTSRSTIEIKQPLPSSPTVCEASVPVVTIDSVNKLSAALRRALLSFDEMVRLAGRRLTYREAYEMLKHRPLAELIDEWGYAKVPNFLAWEKALREALKATGRRRNSPRAEMQPAIRQNGKSAFNPAAVSGSVIRPGQM